MSSWVSVGRDGGERNAAKTEHEAVQGQQYESIVPLKRSWT